MKKPAPPTLDPNLLAVLHRGGKQWHALLVNRGSAKPAIAEARSFPLANADRINQWIIDHTRRCEQIRASRVGKNREQQRTRSPDASPPAHSTRFDPRDAARRFRTPAVYRRRTITRDGDPNERQVDAMVSSICTRNRPMQYNCVSRNSFRPTMPA